MKIRTFKYEKIFGEEVELQLPTEKSFYFETGIRRSICVIPQWTTWNKEQYNKEEELYAYDFICIYQDFSARIERFTIPVAHIEEKYNTSKGRDYDLIHFFATLHSSDVRTQERFMQDYNSVIEKISKQL